MILHEQNAGTPADWYCEGCESLQGDCAKVLGVYLCARCRAVVVADIQRDREEQTAELSGQDIQQSVALEARAEVLLTDEERRLLPLGAKKEWVN